jgi:hypothetical protein
MTDDKYIPVLEPPPPEGASFDEILRALARRLAILAEEEDYNHGAAYEDDELAPPAGTER